MLILLCIAHFNKTFVVNADIVLLFFAAVLFYILPMLLLHFITQKNDLTNKGTNTILLYAFLTGMLPNALTSTDILISNAFLILAIWNLLHLRNEKRIKAKILNTSIYIGIASIAFFWSLGFLLLVYLAVFYFEPKNYRNWIIPIIGLCIVYLFTNCFTLLFYDSFFSIHQYVDIVSLSFQNYLQKEQLFSVGILLVCVVVFLSIYLIKLHRKPANLKPILRLIVVYLVLSICVIIVSPQKDTSELLLIIPPLAIIGTTCLEIDYNPLAREINIWIFLLLPFTMLLF